MKHLIIIALLLFTTVSTGLFAQTSEMALPADIDPLSYSRLPLIYKDSLDAEGQRIFEVINGTEATQARFGPPNNSMYSLEPSEPYDVMKSIENPRRIAHWCIDAEGVYSIPEFNI